MNTKDARKAIPHRLDDVIACLKWKRYIRLHLASNLLTELATVVESGSRSHDEKVVMIALKSAVLVNDCGKLKEIREALK